MNSIKLAGNWAGRRLHVVRLTNPKWAEKQLIFCLNGRKLAPVMLPPEPQQWLPLKYPAALARCYLRSAEHTLSMARGGGTARIGDAANNLRIT